MENLEILLDEYLKVRIVDKKQRNSVIAYYSKEYIFNLCRFCKIPVEPSTIYSIINSNQVDKAMNLDSAIIIRNTTRLINYLLRLEKPIDLYIISDLIRDWHEGLLYKELTKWQPLNDLLSKNPPVDLEDFFKYLAKIHIKIHEQNIGGEYMLLWSHLALSVYMGVYRIPPLLLDAGQYTEYQKVISYSNADKIDPLVNYFSDRAGITLTQLINLYKGHRSISRQMLGQRISSLENRIDTLDKKVGKYSKDYLIQKEIEFNNWFEKIKEWIIATLKEKEGVYFFEWKAPIRIENLPSVIMYKLINNYRNQTENLLMSIVGTNLIDIFKKGTSILIEMVSRRKYIPNAYLSFSLIPTKYVNYLSSVSAISLSKDGSEQYSLDKNINLSEISLSSDPEDWNEKEIEGFFIESVENFYNLLEEEITLRTTEG